MQKKKLVTAVCFGLVCIAIGICGFKADKRIAVQTVSNNIVQSNKNKPVITIDAGHGGMDGGCVSINNKCEKDINLNILLSLRDMAKIMGYNPVCTRESDVSIHDKNIKFHGAQMFYCSKIAESEQFADIMQKQFVSKLQPDNKRETKPVTDELYLLCNAKCPAIMIECGFLSNKEEADKLENKDYQKQVAFTIFSGISDFESQMMNAN